MSTRQDLSDSLENYLEVILDLEQTNKVARAKEIADRLDIQRGSVTGGLKALADKVYINYKPYSFITLTPKGKRIAKDITYRHAVIQDFLSKVLQIDPETADETACRMEHAIDAKTMPDQHILVITGAIVLLVMAVATISIVRFKFPEKEPR